MPENEPPKPGPEHLARFQKSNDGVGGVPKDEAFRAKLTLRANVVAASAGVVFHSDPGGNAMAPARTFPVVPGSSKVLKLGLSGEVQLWRTDGVLKLLRLLRSLQKFTVP